MERTRRMSMYPSSPGIPMLYQGACIGLVVNDPALFAGMAPPWSVTSGKFRAFAPVLAVTLAFLVKCAHIGSGVI
jgi:hypothetical protein